MKIWVDARISPAITAWMKQNFSPDAVALREIGLRDAEDEVILQSAKNAGAVIMTKDADFLTLLARFGPPPQVIWVTCGNTSNLRLKEILSSFLPDVINLLESGEPLVEIGDA